MEEVTPFDFSEGGAWPGTARPGLAGVFGAWLEVEQRRFVLWLPVALLGGVLAYFELNHEPPWWLGPAIGGAGFVSALLLRNSPLVAAPLLMAGSFGLGIAAAQLATARAPPLAVLPRHATIVTGRIAAVEPLPNGARITFAGPRLGDAPPIARSLRIRLRRGDPIKLAAGQEVQIRALLEPPFPPAYPGAWDIERSSFFSGFAGYGFALGPAKLIAPAKGGPARRFEALRESIARRIRRPLPGTEGTIAATLMSGISTAIPESDRAAFRDSGLAHLLAVAGLHIGIVMGFVFMLSRALFALSERATLYWPTKQLAALAALGAGGLYMLLTGMHVPIMRSFAMAVLAVAGLIAGRRVISLRGLALAATILLLLAPAEAVGVSFQMSFAAVLVLISGYEALRPWLSRLHGSGSWGRRFGMHVLALALTSLLAGTAALPFAAYHFGHIQVYYVLANLIAVPITAIWVMPAGLVSLVLMPLHLERLALLPMGWGIHLLLIIARDVSALPAARIAVPHMPAWGLGIVAFGLCWLCLWRSRLRLAGVPLIFAGLVTAFLIRAPDILVSSTAGLIGLHADSTVFVQKTGRADSFTRDAWLDLWPGSTFLPLPATGVLAQGAIRCTRDLCLFRPRPGGTAALLLRTDATPDPCPHAMVVISPRPDRHRCTGSGLPFVDRFSVWRDGSYALWLDHSGVRIVSDRSLRGDRPWVPPPPRPRGAARGAAPASTLPMAPTIPLPAK